MFSETFEYDDYRGNHRKETFYFDISESEFAEMYMSKEGGIDTYLKRITEAQDFAELSKVFKEIILKSVGYISDDGREFVKSEEFSTKFTHTKPYVELYMKMCQDAEYAIKFWNGIIPTRFRDESASEKIVTAFQ